MDSPDVLPQSYLAWMLSALGPLYGVMIPLAGLAVFVGACLVVSSNRRPAVIAAFLLFVPLPLMIGLFGSVGGFIASMQILAAGGALPKASEIGQGISTGLVTTQLGLLLTFPSYFVLACGLFFRTLREKSSTTE